MPATSPSSAARACLGDETGDAHLFTRNLATLAEGLGVRFQYGTPVKALRTEGKAVTGAVTSGGTLTADRYVVAFGSYSIPPAWSAAWGCTCPYTP